MQTAQQPFFTRISNGSLVVQWSRRIIDSSAVIRCMRGIMEFCGRILSGSRVAGLFVVGDYLDTDRTPLAGFITGSAWYRKLEAPARRLWRGAGNALDSATRAARDSRFVDAFGSLATDRRQVFILLFFLVSFYLLRFILLAFAPAAVIRVPWTSGLVLALALFWLLELTTKPADSSPGLMTRLGTVIRELVDSTTARLK